MFSINDVKESLKKNEEIVIPHMTEINSFSPAFAQLHQEIKSKGIAFNYFKKVNGVMLEIDKRLSDKRSS